jgi:predicted RNA binding protein YcfA (HicA-like mRNA interferase family)
MIGARQYLKDTFKYDPPGYRMAGHYLSQNDFKNGVSILQCQINEGTLTPRQSHLDWQCATQMIHSLFNHRSNIYSIVKRGSRPILPSKVFPKPCSTNDMIKIYQKKGFSVISGGKGSHVKLRNSYGDTMILPGNRKELSVGVLNSALKSIGYSIGDLPHIL